MFKIKNIYLFYYIYLSKMSKSEINYNEEFDENSDDNLHSISIKLLNDIEEILESKQLDNKSKVSSLSNIL